MLYRKLNEIAESIELVHRKLDHIMTDQDKLDADVAALEQGFVNIATEITTLKAAAAAGQPLNFDGLDKAVADLTSLAPVPTPAPVPPAA